MRSSQQTQGVNARRAIVDGRVDNKFVDVPGRLQGIQLRFHLFRGTEQRRRFPPGDARRPAARLTGKGGRLRFAADGDPLAVFQLNAPRLDRFCQLCRRRGLFGHDDLNGNNRVAPAQFAPAG